MFFFFFGPRYRVWVPNRNPHAGEEEDSDPTVRERERERTGTGQCCRFPRLLVHCHVTRATLEGLARGCGSPCP